jgi:DNA-binding NarL/FixJ family response regulator
MSRPRVLIVDDNIRVIDLVSRHLREEFEIVGTALDGAAGLAAALDLQPDLIVSDLSMPIMSGLELASRLREVNHRARVVILTVHRDADLARIAREKGALGYVLKDRVRTDLAEALRRALRGRPYLSPAVVLSEGKGEGEGEGEGL